MNRISSIFLIIAAAQLWAPEKSPAQNLMAAIADVNRSPRNGAMKMHRQDLAEFTNRFFDEGLSQWHIPGAAIAIVKNGKLYFKKGYGISNLEKNMPVDPDRTLFRVGSVSKLVTVISVMQLAERGLLKINDDINQHLRRFKIENPFSNAITIAHLMTHTSGLDHQQIGRYARTLDEIQPLGEYLARHRPEVIFNPGESISYSNYGISLAGFLVEEISGQSFYDYVDERIFRALQMEHSTFHVAKNADSETALGYKFENGDYGAFEPEYLNLAPAGGLLSTAGDMAQLMIATLPGANPAILKPSTLAEMQRRHFSMHTNMPGWCYGYYEDFSSNQRAVMHTGHMRGYSSLLYLVPEQELGIFIACNTNENQLYENYLEQFFDRYGMSSPATTHPTTAVSALGVNRFCGTYQFHSFPERTLAKYAALYDGDSQIEIARRDGGALDVHIPGKTITITAVDDGLFADGFNNQLVAFNENRRGFSTQMYWTHDKPMTLKKVAWWQTLSFQFHLRRIFYAIFTLAIAILIWSYVKVNTFKKQNTLVALVICTLNLIFLIGLDFLFDRSELRFGVPTSLIALLTIPVAAAALSLSLPIITALLWKNKSGSILQRLNFTAMTVAVFAFFIFLDYWNLLGFRF